MRKYIFFCFLGLLGSFSGQVMAQQYCDDFDPNTFQSTTSVWDWRNPSPTNWEAWIGQSSTGGGNTVTMFNLPFPYQPQSGNQFPNVAHLNNNTAFDHQPSDGWELVYRAFGSPVGPIQNPTLVLYNRYRGILRVFIWITVDQTSPLNESGVELYFRKSAGIASSIFSLIETPSTAIEDFDTGIEVITPNSYNNSPNGEWLFADIPTAYDPCTCGYSDDPNGPGVRPNVSEIFVRGMITQTSTFQSYDPEGNAQPPYANQTSTPYGTTASASSIIDKGSKFFKSINALTSTVNDQLSSTSVVPNTDGSYQIKTSKPIKIPAWIKALPYAGDVFAVMDALITGGENGDKASTANTGTPTAVTFSGSISTSGTILPVAFYTPGSPYDDPQLSPDVAKTPVYDQVLGTFNLLEKPVLEYVTYQPQSTTPANYPRYDEVGKEFPGFVLPPIRQYRLKSIPKYVVNPASELELIGLDYAVQYKLGPNLLGFAVDPVHCITAGVANKYQLGLYGPVALGRPLGNQYENLSYVERLRNYGISVALWPQNNLSDIGNIVYTTDFFPASCGTQQSISLAIPSSSTPYFSGAEYTPEITLKVRAILRRTDADADQNTDDVIFMATYEVEVESISGGGTYNISLNNPVPNEATAGGCSPTNAEDYDYTYMREYVVSGFTSSLGNQAFFSLGNSGLPFDLTIENTQINTGTFEALQSISTFNTDFIHTPTVLVCDTIGGQIICGNAPQDPIVLRAGWRISIDPDGLASSDIGPGTTMILELPERFNGCDADPMPSPATSAEIQAICQDGNKYNPVITASPRQEAEESIVKELSALPLTAQPNPFTDELTLAYELPAEAQVQMQLVDMMGRPLRQILPASHRKAGSHEIQVDLNDLAAGMYTVILQAGKHRQTVKVIKR